MRTIKAVPITAENFKTYGSFVNMLSPEGYCFPGDATFYPDPLTLHVRDGALVAFSPLTVKKPERMIVSQAEYHDFSGEGIFVIDDDAVLHVAPPSKHQPIPEQTEAFIVPKGTMVRLKTGVWHLAALPLHNDVLHVMIVLPERTYATDCTVVDYPEDQWVEIVVND